MGVWTHRRVTLPPGAEVIYAHDGSEGVSAFTWSEGSGHVIFCGPEFHEPDYPDVWKQIYSGMLVNTLVSPLLVNLHASASETGAGLSLSCTGMSGDELAALHVEDPDHVFLAMLREQIAQVLQVPLHRLRIVLPDGRLPTREEESDVPFMR